MDGKSSPVGSIINRRARARKKITGERQEQRALEVATDCADATDDQTRISAIALMLDISLNASTPSVQRDARHWLRTHAGVEVEAPNTLRVVV